MEQRVVGDIMNGPSNIPDGQRSSKSPWMTELNAGALHWAVTEYFESLVEARPEAPF